MIVVNSFRAGGSYKGLDIDNIFLFEQLAYPVYFRVHVIP